MIWLKKAAAWLKKWWMWVAFPLGVAWWLLTRGKKTQVTVSSPELLGHQERVEEINAATQKKIEAAEARKAERLETVEETYQKASARLDVREKAQAEELAEDPDALNRYLKEVGRDVRSKNERR